MRYILLACDYDGTLATHGKIDSQTEVALTQLRNSGRRLVMVTGRVVEELRHACECLALFDVIVAENGGVLYWPATGQDRLLAKSPHAQFVQLLVDRHVAPLSVGQTIVATWEPHSTTVLDTIRCLGLDLHVIFNKGAVMILPSGINKATGLAAALDELGISPHNCAAVGDAENDHALFDLCELSVAVQNALPVVQQHADFVTPSDHGAGVSQLISMLMANDAIELEPRLARNHLPVGQALNGTTLSIPPYDTTLLITGQSQHDNFARTQAFAKSLAEKRYQFCLVDLLGEPFAIPSAVTLGSDTQTVNLRELMNVLERPAQSAILDLTAVPQAELGGEFSRILDCLQPLHATTQRPHWLIVNGAHHVFSSLAGLEPESNQSRAAQNGSLSLSKYLSASSRPLASLLLSTDQPERLDAALLQQVNFVVGAGPQAARFLSSIQQTPATEVDEPESVPPGPLLWRRTDDAKIPLAAVEQAIAAMKS